MCIRCFSAQPIAKKQKPSSDSFSSINEKIALLQSPTKLPLMLENARLEDLLSHSVKLITTGEDIEVVMRAAGVDLEKPSMMQLRMLCSKWKIKNTIPDSKETRNVSAHCDTPKDATILQ
jgi:hypothetical protein